MGTELIIAKIVRDEDGTHLYFKRDIRFERCFADLEVKSSKAGIDYFELPSTDSGLGDDMRAWFNSFKNVFQAGTKGYNVISDGYRNFGLLRAKTDGREMMIPLMAASEDSLKMWVNEFIKLHREWYLKFLRKIRVELSLIEKEVV